MNSTLYLVQQKQEFHLSFLLLNSACDKKLNVKKKLDFKRRF